MTKDQLEQLMENLDPEEALAALAAAAHRIFPLLDDEARLNFMVRLVGDADSDKVASMVHLWLAECLGEGVDPTKMCQSLLAKVTRFRELTTAADPELLDLFEEWLEALEEELVSLVKTKGSLDPAALAQQLGISRPGAAFLISKLQREGRL